MGRMADRFKLVYGQEVSTGFTCTKNHFIKCFRVFPSKEMDEYNFNVPHPDFKKQPGVYCKLVKGARTVIMDDSPFREKAYEPFLKSARGNVLIYGVGLGMAVESVLQNPNVKTVTVVEENAGLRKLIEGYFPNPPVPMRWLGGTPMSEMIFPQKDRFFDVVLIDLFPDIIDSPERKAMIEVMRSRIRPLVKTIPFNKTERAIYVWGEQYMKYFPNKKKAVVPEILM